MSQDVQRRVLSGEAAPLQTGDPREIGPFRIRGRIGSGGMGAVYLGTDRQGLRVAVKVIREDQVHDDGFRSRFRREVRAAAGVRSEAIANLVDADPEAAPPWLATEYVEGRTLRQTVAEQGPLPQEAVLRLIVGVAEALAAIHAAGLVHRDVKPANVILGPDGPRLIDLGVVSMVDATQVTTTGQAVGTPMYMSPEQAAGGSTTPATDIWALGALAYFAATGGYLYTGEHPAVVLYRAAAEAPSYDDAPAYLRPLLDACFERDPARRPQAEAILRVTGLREAAGRAGAGSTSPGVPAGGPGPDGEVRLPSWGRSDSQAASRRRRRTAWKWSGISLGILLVPAVVLLLAWYGMGFLLNWTDAGEELRRADVSSMTTSAPTETAAPAGPAEPAPLASRDPALQAVGDGSPENPWAPGSAHRLHEESCWTVAVERVEGRTAILTYSCDARPDGSDTAFPVDELEVWAIGEGYNQPLTREMAENGDTFWAQGPLAVGAERTAHITLPISPGPLTSLEITEAEWAASAGHWKTG